MFDKPNKDIVYGKPVAYEFTYYLSDVVQDSHEYHELLQLLDNAAENDTVRLVINNFGGDSGTCVQIVNCIRECKGHVVGVLSGDAFSAAGVIFMACDSHEVGQHTVMMAHQGVGGMGGKFSEFPSRLAATLNQTKSLYHDVFLHFFSVGEIDAILDGKDIWLNTEEIIERLEKRAKAFQEQQEEAEQEMKEALEEMYASPPKEVLAKLTKAQLISYINDEIYIDIKPDGTYDLIEVD